MLLIYIKVVSILNIFIAENTFFPSFLVFCLFASFNFILAMGNLGGSRCEDFIDFQVGFTSASPRDILCIDFCISFTYLVFVECLWCSWHCAFWLPVPWIFRQKQTTKKKKKNQTTTTKNTSCLDCEFGIWPGWICPQALQGDEFQPLIAFSGVRRTRGVTDLCCLRISHSLKECICIHMNNTDFLSGEKTVLSWLYHGGEILRDSLLPEALLISTRDLDNPLFDPPGWWESCSFTDM